MEKEKIFRRGNGEKCTQSEMIRLIAEYIAEDKDKKYDITVGTDSQNHASTKMVEVVAVHRVGHGGIFFYRTEYLQKITSLKQKIYKETSRSIENATGLVDGIGDILIDEHEVLIDDLDINFSVHCDIGHYGKTNQLISEIVAWVHSAGFDVAIKPDSYTASGIANKFSK